VRVGDANHLGLGEEVHFHHAADDGLRRGAELAEAAHPGAVHQHIEPAEPGDGRGDDPLAVFRLRKVARERLGLRPGGPALADDLREVFGGTRRQRQSCAELRQALGRSPADAPRRPGDQHTPTAQIPPHHPHRSSSPSVRQNRPVR
jgi:hypothetical protein